MLQGDWKLHLTTKGETLLYNLSDNPEEDVNLADEQTEILNKLIKNAEDWIQTLPNKDGARAIVMGPVELPVRSKNTGFSP